MTDAAGILAHDCAFLLHKDHCRGPSPIWLLVWGRVGVFHDTFHGAEPVKGGFVGKDDVTIRGKRHSTDFETEQIRHTAVIARLMVQVISKTRQNMQRQARRRRFGAAMKTGWTRLLDAARPRTGFSIGRQQPHPRSFFFPPVAPAPVPAVDPVELTILAVNRLGPATIRSSTTGKAVSITVPDARIGDIFRSALAEMQKARRTDRLVEIIVAED